MQMLSVLFVVAKPRRGLVIVAHLPEVLLHCASTKAFRTLIVPTEEITKDVESNDHGNDYKDDLHNRSAFLTAKGLFALRKHGLD